MNTVLEVLQSDTYLKATPEQQQLFLQDNGIDTDYLTSVGLSAPKEVGVFKKLGRAATRGVASAIENVASIPLRGNIFEGEEESSIDPLAIKIRDYASSYLDSNPSLTKPSDNYLTRITTSAIESTPTSLGYALPNLIALGLDSTVVAAAAGLGISAATFQGMKNATAVTNFINQYKELKDKGLPVDVDKLKAVSLKQGTSEGATEVGSDVVSGLALRMLPGGTAAKAGTDLLRSIFKPTSTTIAKQFGKALAISQVGEQAGEITNLFYQEGQREELGLDNRAKEQLAETIGTTALLGGGIMATGAAVTTPMHRARINTVKDTLFNGIEDASTLEPKQQEEYIQKRLKAASELVPIVEENMGEEAARNFMLNVVDATKAAVDPTVESKGSLPFNASIFTPELDFSNTVSVGQTQDINPMDAVQKSVFSKRKGAENFIKQSMETVSDTDALSEVISTTAIPTDFSYATLGALQTQPTTMPIGIDEVVVPDNRDKFIPQQPVHTNQKSIGSDPMVTAQESRQLLQENLKGLDLKLRNPLYVEKLSDGELVELRAADLTNLFSKQAIANVSSEFDKRQQAQLDAQQVKEEPVLEQSNTITTPIEEKPLVEAPSASNMPIVEQGEVSIPVETKTPLLKRKGIKPTPKKLVKLDRIETEVTPYHSVGEEITGKATLPKVKDIEKELNTKKAEVRRLETSLQDKYASPKKKADIEVRRDSLLTEIDNLELNLEDAKTEVQKHNEEVDKEVEKDSTSTKKSKGKVKKTSVADLSDTMAKVFDYQKTKEGEVRSTAEGEYKTFLAQEAKVGASRAVPKRFRQFVEQVKDQFKLKENVFILTRSDLTNSNIGGLDSALLTLAQEDPKTYFGMIDTDTKGNKIIVLNDTNLKNEYHTLETLSHELGHWIDEQTYAAAPSETKVELENAFYSFLERVKAKDISALKEIYSARTPHKTWNDFEREFGDYKTKKGAWKEEALKSEWIAQQIMKYLGERQSRPEGAIAKYFTNLADKLKQLFAFFKSVAIKQHLPVPAVSKWLDNHLESMRVFKRLQEMRVEYSNYVLPGEKTSPFNLLLDGSDTYNALFYAENTLPETHFGAGNWVHIRGDQRTLTDGSKTLFINEVQSDWDKQYTKSVKDKISDKELAKLKYELQSLPPTLNNLRDNIYAKFRENFGTDEKELYTTYANLEFFRDPGEYARPNFYHAVETRLKEDFKGDIEEFVDKLREDITALEAIKLRLGELNQKLAGQEDEIASPPIEGKYWLNHSLNQIIRYAKEKGLSQIAFPSTPEQVASVEKWGELEEKDGRYLAHGQDMTSIIDRMVNTVPRELQKLVDQYGGKVTTKQLEAGPVTVLELSDELVEQAYEFGPKFSKIDSPSEKVLRDAQQRESSRIVHRMISGVFDLKNVAVDNLVIPFIRGEHGNYVYKKLLELYNNRQNNYSNFVFNAMIDENGRPVFEEAQEAYRDLNDEQRAARTHLLYVGDARKEEYTTLKEANAALKEQAEKKNEYAAVIDQQTFEAYVTSRAAINNAFKSQSAQLFSYLANTVFSKYGDDVVVAATKALVKSGKKDASGKVFGKDARIAYLRDYLTTNGFDSKVIPKIIEDFKSTMVQNMKLIKYSLGGGLTGAVPRVRPAKADNPFVFHLYRNHTNKAGEVHKQKVYAKFFSTQGELDEFVKKVNAPEFDLKEIFPFNTVGEISEFKDTATNQLMYTAEKDTNAEVSDLFRVSPQDRKLTQALITNVLSRLSDSSSISKEEQELIQKEIYKEYTKKIIANSIPRYLARSKIYIGGFNVVDPLSSMIDSLSSIASYVATNDYINQTMQVINKAKGDTKLQLTREFKNSLTQVHEAVRTINNVVSGTFLMLKTVTALSQLHQYASFGLPLMVKQGVPVTRAARLLLASYLKIVMHRFQMETGNLRRGISGDSPFAKHMRKAPMYGVLVQAAKDIEKDMKSKNGQLFSEDELAMLMEHRINNDTYEGITKEYNTVENSIKDNMSSFANTYVVKPGMWFFNQMEISNREASLLAMYRYQRDTLKKTHEDANKEATKFMLRVNSDFSKVNKIGLLRKYPNFSMLFQLTSFFFHAAGMVGLSAIDAGKAVSKGKFTDPSVKAMFVMMGVFVALGGVKGSPFVEFFNKLLSIMFGEDFLLSIEKDIEEFVVDNTDPLSVERYISKKIADMFMRGTPAVVNLDWSANVALRPPFLDAFLDQAYSSKAPTGLVAGAGPNWLIQFFKSLGYVGDGEFWRALATAPLGGFSDIGKAVIYSKEGYGSAKGGVSYIGTEQRKLTKGQAVVKSLGLKTTDMAKTQDIINAEYTVVKGHWERKRSNAITEYVKKISPFILNKEPVPEKVAKEALESIQKFNNSWMKADKDIRTTVKPIDSETINSSIKTRLFPKKKSLIYQTQQTDILNKE